MEQIEGERADRWTEGGWAKKSELGADRADEWTGFTGGRAEEGVGQGV